MLIKHVPRIGRICTRARSDQGIIDIPLDIPMGKSDMNMKTRVSFLSQDMADEAKTGIRGLTSRGFRMFDGSFLYGPIAVFPNVALSWRVARPENITPESLKLFFMLQPKLDVLVIGVGGRKDIDKVRKQVIEAIHNERIGLELAPTEDAVPIFNWLNAEYRCIAGCFYPDEELPVSKVEATRSLSILNKNYDRMTEHPFSDFLTYKDHVDRALDRMYGANSPELYKAREMLDKIRKEDLNQKLEQEKEQRLKLQEFATMRRVHEASVRERIESEAEKTKEDETKKIKDS